MIKKAPGQKRFACKGRREGRRCITGGGADEDIRENSIRKVHMTMKAVCEGRAMMEFMTQWPRRLVRSIFFQKGVKYS